MLGLILGGVAFYAAYEWWKARHAEEEARVEAARYSTYLDAFEVVPFEPRAVMEDARGKGKTVFETAKFLPGPATVKGASDVKEGERVQVRAVLEDGGGYWAVFEGPFVPENGGEEAHVLVDRVVQERPDEFFAASTAGRLGRLGKPIGSLWSSLQRPEWGVGDPNMAIGDDTYRSLSVMPELGAEVLLVLEEKNPLGAARVLARGKVLDLITGADGVTKARLGVFRVIASMGPLWGRLFVPKSMVVPVGLLAEKVSA